MRRHGLGVLLVCGLTRAAIAQPLPPVDGRAVPSEPVATPAPDPTPSSAVTTEPTATAPTSVVAAAPAPVADTHPIKVSLVCQATGRTKACPAFLQGIIDANPVLLISPLAGADVVVYVTATEVALVDRVHLRFVSSMTGAPPVIELDVDVSSRGTDDEQRAQLTPAFLRGIAVFVGARHPDAVKIELVAPTGGGEAKAGTSPWGFSVGGQSSANYTEKYRNAGGDFNVALRYTTTGFRALVAGFANGGINRQPPLVLDDGTVVDLNSYNWGTSGGGEAIKLLDQHWSLGLGSYSEIDDKRAQYSFAQRTRAAIAYDRFRADDPRGNRLEIFYHLGSAYEHYNLRNEIGETKAWYAVHGVDAFGSVRHDKITYGLQLETNVQLDHPGRRFSLTASPFTTIQLGDHIDLSLSFSITKRELPAPDPAVIDPSDFQQTSRLQFAEPLSMNASFSLTFHWDATNGERNDRLGSI